MSPIVNDLNPTPESPIQDQDVDLDAQDDVKRIPFPTGHLPPVLADMVREVSRVQCVPESMPGGLVLAAVSAALGRNLSANLRSNKTTRGNIYVLLSAESGTGKSESFRVCTKRLYDCEKILADQWKKETRPNLIARQKILTTEMKTIVESIKTKKPLEGADDIHGLLANKQKELDDLQCRLIEPQLITEDVTTQRLAMLLQNNQETIAMLSGDGGDVINNILGRYNTLKRVDDSLYVKALSGDPVKVDRVGSGKDEPRKVDLTSPCMTMALLVQPDKIDTLVEKSELSTGGFLPRCLIVQTDAEASEIQPNAPAMDPQVSGAYNKLIDDLIHTFRLGSPHTVNAQPVATTFMNNFHNQIVRRRKTDLADVNIFASRYAEQACRLSVVLHAAIYGKNACRRVVELTTVLKAITLTHYFMHEQHALFHGCRQQLAGMKRDRVKELFQSGTESVSVREIQRRKIVRTSTEGEYLLNQMVEEGILDTKPIETGGRPSTRYILKANIRM